MTPDEERRVQEFKGRIGYDAPVSREELKNALESAMKDRGLYLYGLYKSNCMGRVENAMDGMLNQSSKNGMIVFEQEFTALSEDYAEKHIHNCPLINAFQEVGATPEEIRTLCPKILGPSDAGILEPFSDKVELSFPKTLSTDDVCIMCVKKKTDS